MRLLIGSRLGLRERGRMTKKKNEHVEIYNEEKNAIEVVDVSDKHLEKMARGYILGSQTFDNQSQLKAKLEEKVTKKIGRKGQFLVAKLFELIEGVYIVDKRSGKDGKTIKYYQQPPNLQAITYALDRVLGKPVTRSEHNETKKGLVLVEHIIKGLAVNPQKRSNEQNGVGKNVIGTGGEGGEDRSGGSVIEDNINEAVGSATLS